MNLIHPAQAPRFGATVGRLSSVLLVAAALVDMERQVSEKLEAEAVDRVTKIRKVHLEIIANLTGRLEQFLKDNPNVSLITSMQDFERLVKTHILLSAKPTEIVDQQITVISAVPSTR